jgi:hypothetical protein
MGSIVSYTIGRLGLLVTTYALGYIAGVRGYWLIILAFIGSAILSYFVLSGQRSKFGDKVVGFAQRINDKIDEDTRKEDID